MPRHSSKTKNVRLNIETSPHVRKEMERLVLKTDAASISEVIRKAITVYAWVVDNKPVVTMANGQEVKLEY